ncbi:ABC transporter ATP-binding protein [Sagittula stellata]|uniref:Iron(III) ABC transporter, ATP-binding protein n=1 Tax=Sagittula stellata (strain ATCC 700073 / DSM 11524 / E-37) TaxID=388399 RepID=A3K4W6_SAGS3|nr:ABC transporter ATP-binding protein [Sagittula stellata]EBA08015.1 iron(III) ABC transporter, ATP-binding protein [Sagittula stellata E-37]
MILTEFRVHASRRCLLDIAGLELPSRGLVGVIGPNGAGKSTLMKALAGVIPHDGQKSLEGGWPDPAGIGYLPQDFTVSAAMSVAECVLLGRRERLGWWITARDRAEVARVLAHLDLGALAGARMDRLSGGQQQRVLLAQKLLRDPRLLILDEPTSALDLHHQLEVLTHLQRLSRDRLVLVSLHDLTLVGRFAEQVVLIEQGAVRTAGQPKIVLHSMHLDHVYAIDSQILSDRNNAPVVIAHRPEERHPEDGNDGDIRQCNKHSQLTLLRP